MTVEVGQYWKHDNRFSGMTIWLITGLVEYSAEYDDPAVTIKLIADETSFGGNTDIGAEREYQRVLDEMSWWTLIEEEDIPLYLLGSV